LNSKLIIESLEQAAQACEDPTSLVYKRLFLTHPEMEELFLLDRQDEAKGHMLFEVIECIIDFVGPRYTSEGLISSELINHEQIGVSREIFGTFFATVRDTFKELLADNWTAAYERAWDQLLEDLSRVIQDSSPTKQATQ